LVGTHLVVVPKIRILDITSKIPKNTRYVSDYSDILDINDFEKEMEKAEVFTGIAINHKIMNNKRIFSNKVTVTGIENNHCYLYQYTLDDKWVVENPPRLYRSLVDEDDMTMLVVGDPQIGGNRKRIAYKPESGGLGIQRGKDPVINDSFNWRDILHKATTLNPDINFIISCGDQVHSDSDDQQEMEYAGFLSAPQLRSFPLAVVAGNHDQLLDSENFKHHFNLPNRMTNELNTAASGPDYFFVRGKAL